MFQEKFWIPAGTFSSILLISNTPALLSSHQLSTQALQPTYKLLRLWAKPKQKNTAHTTDEKVGEGDQKPYCLKAGNKSKYLYSATLAMVQLSPQGWTPGLSLVVFSWLYSQEKGEGWTWSHVWEAGKRSFRLQSHSIKVCPCGSLSVLTSEHFQRQKSVSTGEVSFTCSINPKKALTSKILMGSDY